MTVIDGGCVMITGALSPLGAEFARQMAKRARSLVLVGKGKELLEEFAKELKEKHQGLEVMTQQCDMTRTDDVERMVNSVIQATQVDVLVNNAGLADFAFFDKSEWGRNLQMIEVNVLGLGLLTHKLVPHMVSRGRGGIINIGSGPALMTLPCSAIHNATRHFVDGLTQSLTVDLAGTGVVVTQVTPGPLGGEEEKGMFLNIKSSCLRISPTQCAKEAIAGFDCKRVQVVPGFIFRWMWWFYSFIPTLMVRTLGQVASRALRQQEQKVIEDQSRKPSKKGE